MIPAITVRPIENREEWEPFCLSQALPQFMQAWDAGLLMRDMGEEILRLGLFEDTVLVGVCLASIVRARRGTYLYVPYGPVLREWKIEHVRALTAALKQYGIKEKADFIRIAPFLERTDAHIALLAEAGYRVAPIHMLAESLWLLDLAGKDEPTLLANMSKTTRYSIKRGAKDGVEIRQTRSQEDVSAFLQLHDLTKERHHFTPYPDKLFRKQVERFAEHDHVSVLTASHEGKILASAIVMYYGQHASYHHGASIPSRVPAAYALQWAAILEAKKRGCSTYNFWGVTDLKDKKHPFYGISLFKTRFGGRPFALVPCHDLPLTTKYWLTYTIESIRRIRRGFGWKRH